MRLSEARVSIIGLGLMGGSIARALHGVVAELIGADWDPLVVDLAAELKVVDRATNDINNALESCDLVLLATPVRAILDTLTQMGRHLPAPPRVFDIGSTKVEIVQAMNALPKEIDILGGHPLCGKELVGLANSDADLFRDKAFVITPLERTSEEMLQLAHELIAALGARPLIMDAQQHDSLVAITSHLPHLIAFTICGTAGDLEDVLEQEVIKFSASGFRDFTRIVLVMVSDDNFHPQPAGQLNLISVGGTAVHSDDQS